MNAEMLVPHLDALLNQVEAAGWEADRPHRR